MCGIAGGLSLNETRSSLADTVRRLTDEQARRGPDGDGFWTCADKVVAFGHRRLAIIDVGSSGAQPMHDASGRFTITFNGEIYNHGELRAELEALGRNFRTRSDTEVIIQSIAQWGEAGIARLRGMYAFALWDSQERELWLARDPFGVKPLYVAERDGSLWFASQARALARVAPIDTSRDPAALVGFYIWGHVPEPFTWWSGIRMFPAGHVQRIRPGRAAPAPKRFYEIADAFTLKAGAPLTLADLREALRDSVRHHLIADVPVGVFLSAGIDSGVLATLARECQTEVHTVTLAFRQFQGRPEDEAPAAEALARRLKTQHATVRIEQADFEAIVDDFLLSMDQPSIDGLNTYLVSRAAAGQGIKVALSGLGADELVGGYPSFREIPRLLKIGRRVPLRSPLGKASQFLGRRLATRWIPPKLPSVLAHSGTLSDAYMLRRSLYLAGELDALIDQSWLTRGLTALRDEDSLRIAAQSAEAFGMSLHAQIALMEARRYMRNQLLRDTDWASMAHGLEVRVPFVDVKLLERIGPSIASEHPLRKSDLAEAGGLPSGIAARPKSGFTTPVRDWMGASSARGLRGWAGFVHGHFRTSEEIRSRTD
jgi:asparagine synthase (glutamine-hydrolysing)